MLVKSGCIIAIVRLDAIDGDFARAELRLEGLRPPITSFEARFFAGEPDASAQTPIDGNPHYLASQFFYGLGVPDNELFPQGSQRIEGSNQSVRTQIRINITSALRAYLQNGPREAFPLTVVTVDREGKEIPKPELDLDGISISFS